MEAVKEPSLQSRFEELSQFLVDADRYQKEYPRERSKLTLLLIKQSKRYAKKREDAVADFQSDIGAARIKHASVDKDDNVIEHKYDVKQGKGEDNTILRMAYKKEAQEKLNKEIEKMTKDLNDKVISIQPPYSSGPFFLEVPSDFDFKYLDSFKKFIFNPEISEEEEEKIYLAQKPVQKPAIQSVLNGQ